MTEERKSYEILYEKIMFVDKYRMLKPHWIKFHNYIEKLKKENEELKEITNGYNSLKKDSEAFGGIPLIIADEKYFNEGIFKESYINKDKIRELLKEHHIEFGEETIAMSEQGAFGFMLSIKELLEEE